MVLAPQMATGVEGFGSRSKRQARTRSSSTHTTHDYLTVKVHRLMEFEKHRRQPAFQKTFGRFSMHGTVDIIMPDQRLRSDISKDYTVPGPIRSLEYSLAILEVGIIL